MKRLMTLLTAIFLVAAVLVGGSASAQTMEDVEEIVAVMDIMTYDENGNFNGNESVTRGQLAKIAINMSEYEGLVAWGSRISPFADVSFNDWAAPYISVVTNLDIMDGYMDGTFRPNEGVTYEQAISVMLKLLGYEDEDFLAGYPYSTYCPGCRQRPA